MKKIIAVILTAGITVSLIGGCGSAEKKESRAENVAAGTEEDLSQYSLETLKAMPEFSTTDFDGNQVSNEIFKGYDLTLINLWGTWCSPCVAELPALQKASEQLKGKKIQIIGVCEDADSELEQAKKILKEKGVTFTNLVPNADFRDKFISLCQAFPSNIVVDSDGKVVKNVFSGAQETDELVDTLENLLDKE